MRRLPRRCRAAHLAIVALFVAAPVGLSTSLSGFVTAGEMSVAASLAAIAPAQDEPAPPAGPPEPAVESPKTVEIEPSADDGEIARRLVDILEATGWYESPAVDVREGVAFMTGVAKDDRSRLRAGEIARSTESVVEVVNQMTVRDPDIWDLSPAAVEVRELARGTVQLLPLLAIGLLILLLTWWLAKLVRRLASDVFSRRMPSALLGTVLANAIALPVLLAGVYLAMRVSGLTQLAATVAGGTGLLGLIVGIAFRDIAENYLASILISVNRPFAIGDRVLIEGHDGFVQAVTTRGTLLMTLEGNHVHIPNSNVYKAVVVNQTANPNVRQEFVVGIDYEDSVSLAQETALKTLTDSPYILPDPAPMVLVEELGASTINLRVLFWINAEEHSIPKVRSRTMREVKADLAAAGMSFPDGEREQIFPKPVAVRLLQGDEAAPKSPAPTAPQPPTSEDKAAGGEGDMQAEAVDIRRQAENSRLPDQGEELLS